jgi:heat shock protein HslJ
MLFLPLARIAILTFFMLALVGCSYNTGGAQAHGAAAVNAATTPDSLAQTSWELVRWTRPDGTLRQVPQDNGGEPIRLSFIAQGREYRVAGYAGCNEYRGTYMLTGGKLTIKVSASGRIACASAQRQQLEAAYLQALSRIARFTLDSGGAPRHMTFNVQNGDVLEFTRRQDLPSA